MYFDTWVPNKKKGKTIILYCVIFRGKRGVSFVLCEYDCFIDHILLGFMLVCTSPKVLVSTR